VVGFGSFEDIRQENRNRITAFDFISFTGGGGGGLD